MHTSSRTSTRARIAAGVAGAAIALGGGGAALAHAQGSSDATPTAPGTAVTAPAAPDAQGQSGQQGGRRGGKDGMRGGQEAQELATKLGVDVTTLENAMKTARESMPKPEKPAEGTAPTPPSEADRAAREDAMAQALATALGKDKATVANALAEVRTEHQAAEKKAMSARLDAAVSAGKITSADKDSILKAVDAGVLGGGMGGGMGGHGR